MLEKLCTQSTKVIFLENYYDQFLDPSYKQAQCVPTSTAEGISPYSKHN